MSKSTILKNGVRVHDTRLTRIPDLDERSRDYPITAVISDRAKPRSYTWRCDIHLDQGSEGACCGFGFAHELIARPSVVSGIDAKFAKEKIYWEAQKIDQWSGGSYPGASPKYEGTSVLAAAKVVQRLGYIKEYRWAFGIDELILAVGHKGPAVIGVNWYQKMRNPDVDGFIHPIGDMVGGHCLLVKGVNINEEYLTLHNSWGADWGVGGDCKITFADMHYLLQQKGEVCIPLSRNNKKTIWQNLMDMINSIKEIVK